MLPSNINEQTSEGDAIPSRERQPLSGTALASIALIVALWGGNTVAVSFSVDTLPPVAVAGMRFALGTAVMYFWCRFTRTRLRADRRELWVSFIAGFLLFTQISTFNVAVRWTNSTHGALLINTFPLFVAAIEHFVTRADRLTLRRLLGSLLAIAGVATVTLEPNASSGVRSFLAGDLLLLISSLLLAIRVVYVKYAVRTITPGKLIFWHDVFGVLMFAAWSLATENFAGSTFSTAAVLGLLYQGLIVAGFCFVAHASLLRQYSASQIAVFSFATPVFGVLFSIMLRNEPFTAAVAVGAACVAFGIWITHTSRETD